MLFNYIIIISLIIVNCFIFYNLNYFSKILNVYDHPDDKRKTHKKITPLLGGPVLALNLLLISFINYTEYGSLIFLDNIFINSKSFYIFYTSLILIFITGYYDDKFNVSANKKLIIIGAILFSLILLDEHAVIKKLHISSLNEIIYMEQFGILFSVMCILLFINALNMIDGINMLASIYVCIIFIFFIFNNVLTYFFIFLLIPLVFIIVSNYFNKLFLGDSGTYLLGFIISYTFVKSYNISETFIPEEIVTVMIIPGLDLLRLSIERLSRNKHPFKADRNHLHHLLIDKFNSIISLIIMISMISIPILLGEIISFNFGIFSALVIYSLVLFTLKYQKLWN